MTSNINYTSINAAFPVAGQDNDSQGFRDNFGVIKTALSTASIEISDIQLNYAKLNAANFFDGNTIEGAVFKDNAYETQVHDVNPSTVTLGKFDINYAGGNYHIVNLSTNTNFQVNSWPTDSYAKITMEVVPQTTATMTVTFSSPNGGTILKEASLTLPSSSSGNQRKQIWDLWTRDNGQNVFVKYIGSFGV
jgi:hypothetical protein